jgi:chromosome segregation ATPase
MQERDTEIEALKDKNKKVKTEAQREIRRAERLQQEMLTIKEVNDVAKRDLAEEKEKYAEMEARYNDMETKLVKMTGSLDRYQQVAEELKATNEELDKKIEFHLQHEGNLISDKERADEEVVAVKREFKKKVQEVQFHSKRRDKAEQDKDKMARLKNEADAYKNWLKDEMKNVLKSVEGQRRDGETDEKLIKELQQQVTRLTGSLHNSQEKNALQFKLVEVYTLALLPMIQFVLLSIPLILNPLDPYSLSSLFSGPRAGQGGSRG